MLLSYALNRLVRNGDLTVIDAHGRRHRFGQPGAVPAVAVRLHDRRLHAALLVNPDLYLGEAYMDGTLTIEQGTLTEFLDLLGRNIAERGLAQPSHTRRCFYGLIRLLERSNTIHRSRASVVHHYDYPDELWDLFLDKGREYTCAYFAEPEMGLDEAQHAKREHIARKLLLYPGCRVLEIGSGWGGFAVFMAQRFGADVTGLTLSEPQLNYARIHAQRAGVSNQVRFHGRDYRQETGVYDRVVEVGMMEHVGRSDLKLFCETICRLLTDKGVALLHSIGRNDAPRALPRWIHKYIFPGSYIPCLSELTPRFERTGLLVTDIEVLRLHYVRTLDEWAARFAANRGRVAQLLDERFCRMWEFYLAGGRMAFRWLGQVVFQTQLAKNVTTVPLTRVYLYRSNLGPVGPLWTGNQPRMGFEPSRAPCVRSPDNTAQC